MKRILPLLLTLAILPGCTSIQSKWMRRSNPYEDPPFYTKYLQPGNPLDDNISRTLEGLRLEPWNAPLHNALGELLLTKGLPKWSEVEFRRAVASDKRFYPAWYNLGLIREARGDERGAIRAFRTALDYKPGHAAAHFQLALVYEREGRTSAAIDHYAEAFRINQHLLSPSVNPRVVDSKLVERALMKNYRRAHAEKSLIFEPTPDSYPETPRYIDEEPLPQSRDAAPATTTPAMQARPASPMAAPQPATTPTATSMSGAVYPPPGSGTLAPEPAPVPDAQTDPRWKRFSKRAQERQADEAAAAEEAGKETPADDDTAETEDQPQTDEPPSPPNQR